MEQGWFERLTGVMAAMAGGDAAALEELYVEFGDPIRNVVRKELRRLGVVPVDSDDVEGLTLDVCTELFRRAGSWDPSRRAAPWTWARLRIRAVVSAWVGQFADPLPEGGPADAALSVLSPSAAVGDDNVLDTFGRLAALRAELRLLHEALNRVSRPAQQEILFAVRMQAGQGDPSPAASVARARALKPDAVRQTCKRVCDRVRHLAASDPYFAPLADLHLLRRAS